MPGDRHSGDRNRKRKHPDNNQTSRMSPYNPGRSGDQYSPRNNSGGSGGGGGGGGGGQGGHGGGGGGGNGRSRRGRQQSSSSQQQAQQPQIQRTPRRTMDEPNAPDDLMNPVNQPTPPATPRDYYYWEYLTDAAIREWQPTGFSRVKESLEKATKDNDAVSACIIFQELVKSAIDGRLSVDNATRFLTNLDFTDKATGLDLRSLFLSSLHQFEVGDSGEKTTPPNLVLLLKSLIPHTISQDVISSTLESGTLIAIGLVSSMFSRRAIKVTTSLVYKQRRHNLLREETEGFSKLITEFFTASYSSQPYEVVARTGERVKGLVGAFELDPGRVLDVLLDTAACTVVSNARFFVKLLRGSAWWPKHLPTLNDDEQATQQGREEQKAEKERLKAIADGAFFDKLHKEGISAFFESPEGYEKGGNKVAAQLLGFKFRYYQQEDVRESTPENLLVLSALLIKIGFVDLADLYPHLSPRDEEGMESLHTAWKKKMEEKQRGGKRNALMMAGALADDTVPLPPRAKASSNSTPAAEEKKPEEQKAEDPKPKIQDNQKVILLKYLLAVGAIPAAMFILGKYPFLPGPADDIADHIGRILIQSIETVYLPLRPSRTEMGMRKIGVTAPGGLELVDQPRRKAMVSFTISNLKLKTGDIEYRFFWDEWKDGVPVCRDARDVVRLMETLGRILGPRVGRDPGVLTRICRIGRMVLKSPDCTEDDKKRWIDLSRAILVPAVSLTDGNAGLVNEVWRLLECFPTTTRYSLYGEWSTVSSKRIPELKLKVAETERETRDLLKRISKTNVKLMARQLAKVATSMPVVVMQVVLGQVEGYDNLIECVVDAARYFTPLGFDAVGFCVLNSMSTEGKKRVQADGMLTSRWLQSLAHFCGKIYTRYNKQMDPTPILEYVARQLKRNISVDLIVLQQLIQSMAGINPEINLNDAQLQGLAGGEILRKQILKAFRDSKAEDTPDTMKTLTYTLTKSGLATQLLILIAQERQTCVFRLDEDGAPLKVLGNLFDEIHVVLSQYLDLLNTGLPAEKYEEIIPSVSKLCLELGLEPAVAWWIVRNAVKSKMRKVESPEVDDVEMKDAEEATPVVEKKTPWNPVLEKIMAEVKPILPEDVWSKFSLSFYVTFWQLSIYDIHVPMEAYQTETNRINAAVRALDSDRSDLSISGRQKTRERREELMATSGRLSAELKLHIRDHNLARRRLVSEKDHWFASDHYDQREVTNHFIQYCLLPRIMLSPNDASFCSRFIKDLHKMGTPKFHTIGIYDAIFGKCLGATIFICTQREAENYGRFLKEIMTDLHAWHADRALYEANALGKNLCGFNVKGHPFDWEDFRKILYKWHKTLHNAVKNCLSSKEYMHIRNTVVVLKHVHMFFPAVDWIGRTVVEKVEEIGRVEKREDLKIAATTLLGLLKRRESEWVLVAGFQKGAKSEVLTPAVSTKPSPSPATTPAQPVSSTTSINTPLILPPKPEAEKEDGEIDDSTKGGKGDGRRTVISPQSAADASKDTRRAPNLPARPGPIPPPIRRGHSREPPRPQQQQPQQMSNEPSRVGTPRRDDPMPIRGAAQQDLGMRQQNMAPNNRNISAQRAQPQHQLPDRPQHPQDTRRVSDLERRDLRDLVRDPRPGPQVEIRGRLGPGERLPERPGPERRPVSPRRDGRDIRGADMHRRDVERPPRGGRDESFQRPALPSRDERGGRKEPDLLRGNDTPIRQNQPPQQTQPTRMDTRVPTPDQDRARRGERIEERGRRHDQPRHSDPMNVDSPEQQRRTNSERRPEQTTPRQEESPHLQRPPAGPRADVERDRRNRQQVEAGPQTPKERDLFTAPIRAPSGPSIPDHRDQRHVPIQQHHQDPNHGRLNPPDLIIPKGPREPNPPHGPRRGQVWVAPGVQSQSIPGPGGPGRILTTPIGVQPLSSPSDKPMALNLPNDKFEGSQQSRSAPSTPGVDISGIHPDRLRAMAGLEAPQMMGANATPVNPRPESRNDDGRSRGDRDQRQQGQGRQQQQPLPVHPSRMQSIQITVPSGPRGDNAESTSTSPITGPSTKPGSPPTGPSTSRPERNDTETHHQRRRMQAMQNVLGQAMDPAPAGQVIRGRARRPNGNATSGGSTSGRDSGRDSGRGSQSQPQVIPPEPPMLGSGRRGNMPEGGSRRASTSAAVDTASHSGSAEERPTSDHGSRSGRHGRDRDGGSGRERGAERDRERGERERGMERRDRGDGERHLERERERGERERGERERGMERDRGLERDRERDRVAERVERVERVDSRRGSDRGGSSTDRKDRDRGVDRVERVDRGRGGDGERERERDRERDNRERDRDRESRDRKHRREDSGVRGDGRKGDEVKRRRRGGGDNWGGN